MKVLITGGCGFIGSTLADRLLAAGNEVLAIDNFSTGRRDNLVPRAGLTIVEGSITDRELMAATFDSFAPEFVVHAAAAYKDPDAWIEDADTNATGTAITVRESERAGVKRLVYFQTSLCYGLHPDEQPITIDHELRPNESSYAISKTAGERYIALSSLDYVSFRLANGYGPRNVTGPLPTFFQRLTTNKKCFVMDTRRDFVFVEDLVDLVVRALNGEGESGPYHLSSGSDVSIKELFDSTVAALGITLEEAVEVRDRNPDDAFTILLDPSRTSEQFPGWTPKTSLADGVAAAIKYYQDFGLEETYTHLRDLDGE